MPLAHNTRPESLENFRRLMQVDGFDLDSVYQDFVTHRARFKDAHKDAHGEDAAGAPQSPSHDSGSTP